MATQSDEILDKENGNNSDIDPIEVAIDAGATLSKPASASISRKRKIHVNELETLTRKYVSIIEVMLSLKSILITTYYLYLSYNNGFWPLLMIVRIFNENV